MSDMVESPDDLFTLVMACLICGPYRQAVTWAVCHLTAQVWDHVWGQRSLQGSDMVRQSGLSAVADEVDKLTDMFQQH